MIPYCETPWQSVVAAVGGGLIGGLVALLFGLAFIETLVLAGLLGGLGDLGAHLLRRDPQFEAAVARVRGDR